ncbi:MAG: MFS transporter [SAR324 cluster bacterium]|nr:MFS transporter [SAR324 cluster bacterium]
MNSPTGCPGHRKGRFSIFGPRDRAGWILYDWANSAFVLCVITVLGSAYFIALFKSAAEAAGGRRLGPALALRVGGIDLTAEAAWSFIIAASALIVAFSSPLLGALADGLGRKKRFLQAYCLAGAVATLALWLSLPWWAVGLLILAGNIAFEGGNVYYNAFLPQIASQRDQILLSSYGYAAGYLGGVLVLIAALVLFVPPKGSINDAFIMIGIWWGGFGLLACSWLKEHPPQRRRRAESGPVREAWQEVKSTLLGIGRYPQAARFLGAFLLYNDGIATLISNATPFALQNIYLDQSFSEKIGLNELIPAIIMIQIVAVPGSLACAWLANRIGEKNTLFLTLAVFAGVVAYGQVVQVLSEFYVMSALIGLVLGGAQAISRSVFASLIPPGKHAEFFAFFALSSKFSAFAGPFIYGSLLLLTGDTRSALLSLVIFFAAGGVALYFVDLPRGRADALNS